VNDGRVAKRSAFARDEPDLTGIPNDVRRDHERMRRKLKSGEADDPGTPRWLAHAQHDIGGM
jgi:hypothetical protein